jgi:hypothetical protein
LQKIASIFFLSLIIFFQYGKALSYLHCVIENVIVTGSAYCDCEKQNKDNADNAQSTTAQKTTFKEKVTDNLFAFSKQIISYNNKAISLLISSNNISQLPTGFHKSIFQPPKA